MSQEIFEPRRVGKHFEVHEISAYFQNNYYCCSATYDYKGAYASDKHNRDISRIIHRVYKGIHLEKLSSMIRAEDLSVRMNKPLGKSGNELGLEPVSHEYKINIGKDKVLQIVSYDDDHLITAEVQSGSIPDAKKILTAFEKALART